MTKKLNYRQKATVTVTSTPRPQSENRNLTATQTCERVGREALALRALVTRGDHESYCERDGYNLITYKQSDLNKWGGQHVWQAGDDNMSLLPTSVSSVRDVKGWKCINCLMDGDGVVFERPAPNLTRRGSGAAPRRHNFAWTDSMITWFDNATAGRAKKTIPFAALALAAEEKWGCRAPEIEHLQNKINGRDKKKQKS